MQKGFATLEIVFIVLIIAGLASVAVPNATRILDRVALDYETKKIYTDLRALQSFDRMTEMKDSHFNTAIKTQLKFNVERNRYTIMKNETSQILTEHYFSNGVTVTKNWEFKFDDMGKITNKSGAAISDSMEIKSRYGSTYIRIDSVGRFRGSRTK